MSGITLLDYLGLLNLNPKPKIFIDDHFSKSSSPELDNLIKRLDPRNRDSLVIGIPPDLIEVSPFTNDLANALLSKTDPRIRLVSFAPTLADIRASASGSGDRRYQTRHYYPISPTAPTEELILAYINAIRELTSYCLRYYITEDSIIAITESESDQPFTLPTYKKEGITHSYWEFHLQFFQSIWNLIYSFDLPNHRNIAVNNQYYRSKDYSPQVDNRPFQGIHHVSEIRYTLDYADKELIEMINQYTRDQVQNIDSDYDNYVDDIQHKKSRDYNVQQFILVPYLKSVVKLLWNDSSEHLGVPDTIDHLQAITRKINRLRLDIKFPYQFYVDYYDDKSIMSSLL